MNSQAKQIEIYRTRTGKSPFKNWFLGLKDSKTQARIQARINRLKLGNFGDCRNVGEGVFELRIHFVPGYRVYFGQVGSIVILLDGGDKNAQSRDIKEAQKHWKEYKQEHAY